MQLIILRLGNTVLIAMQINTVSLILCCLVYIYITCLVFTIVLFVLGEYQGYQWNCLQSPTADKYNVHTIKWWWDAKCLLRVQPQRLIYNLSLSLTFWLPWDVAVICMWQVIFTFISRVDILTISIMWVLQDHSNDEFTLVQVMAWCLMAPIFYLRQCWPKSMSPYGITWPQWVNVCGIITWLAWLSL